MPNTTPREHLSLDPGWRFHLGDIPFPIVRGHEHTYRNAKAGRAGGAAAPDYDETGWQTVNLPHDWAVHGPFDPEANLSQGYRPRGFAWYRRNFHLPPADKGRYLELQLDGIATHATIWFNGTLVHRNWCGYTSAYIDITPLAQYGDTLNVISVRVDAETQEGWWYEGAGIYRHTWLDKRPPVHIITDGLYANPVRDPAGAWTLPVETTLHNIGHHPATVEVEITLHSPSGQLLARQTVPATVPPLKNTTATLTIPVANPELWSVDTPSLHTVTATLKHDNGQPGDTLSTACGFRTIRFDPDHGFFLNDQPLKLKGTCNHQDHAGVGVAVPDSLWEFRLRRLKEMGSNAYRCAHNPPAREFLDACDRIGILVMDENRLFNCAPEYIRQLQWLVRRDRGHPSVILWSVFNEEPMQGTEQGREMVRRMAAIVRELDTTRPVTAAMNSGFDTSVNVSQAVDLVGFNYQQDRYDDFHQKNPHLPMTSSEDASALMTRDEYTTDKTKNLIGSYDDQFPSWGATHRATWRAIAERPYLAGGFVWTGFDYRGEPTPHAWPSAASFFGSMDLCGFPKSAYHMNQAFWLDNQPVLHLIPHWTWPGKEGQPIKVMAITNAETAELLLNGHSLGEQPVDKYDFTTWEVPYAPGQLQAIARRGGVETARLTIETTGPATTLQLLPDRPTLAGDGWDAQPVTVQALDAQGRPDPHASHQITFHLHGPATLIGLGNGDPNSHEPEKGHDRSLFHGLAQIILQSRPGGHGPLTLRATAEGLLPAEAVITITPAPAPPTVSAESPSYPLNHWRRSPFSPARPDPDARPDDNDQNSWPTVDHLVTQKFDGGHWVVYRSEFTPYAAQNQQGGWLEFTEIAGKAEIWLDGELAGIKSTPDRQPVAIPLPPHQGKRAVNILIKSDDGQRAGLAGPVTVTPLRPIERNRPARE